MLVAIADFLNDFFKKKPTFQDGYKYVMEEFFIKKIPFHIIKGTLNFCDSIPDFGKGAIRALAELENAYLSPFQCQALGVYIYPENEAKTFEQALTTIINIYGIDSRLSRPDFELASLIIHCLFCNDHSHKNQSSPTDPESDTFRFSDDATNLSIE